MAANGNEAITLNQLKQFDSFGAENITPEAIGAADAEHVHDASDVTTGTILPARRHGPAEPAVDAGRDGPGQHALRAADSQRRDWRGNRRRGVRRDRRAAVPVE